MFNFWLRLLEYLKVNSVFKGKFHSKVNAIFMVNSIFKDQFHV